MFYFLNFIQINLSKFYPFIQVYNQSLKISFNFQSYYYSKFLLKLLLFSFKITIIFIASSGRINAQIPESLPDNPTIIPLPPQPSPPELELPQRLPPPEQLLPETEQPLINPDLIPNSENTFIINQFNFEGNTAFTDEELAEITKPFTNRPITFTELLQARSQVTEHYVKKGYVTSGALIPPQTLTEGIVTIQIVEGKVTEINVTGEGRLNSNYVQSRLRLAAQEPLNQNQLLRGLQLLQLNPVIETISAELAAGTRPGESLLNVQFKTADTFDVKLFTNNSRSPSIGSWERGIELNQDNLLGWADQLQVSYSNTEGSQIVDTLYTVPINPRNGTLGFYFNYIGSEITESPFNDLEITAQSRTYELRYRQPIIQTPTEEFALGLTFTRRESDTEILGVGFPLSRGADEEGKTRLSIVRFSQDYINRGLRQVFGVRSQFSVGLGLFNATLNSDQPDSQYFAWRGQTQWVRVLAENTLLLLRSDLQFANQELIPLEQVGLGGVDTVRGYRQDILLRDNFIFNSAELRYPLFETSNGKGLLQLIPFLDFGHAWNHAGELELPDQTLLSVGLGLRWEYSDRITARIDWGIPLIELRSSDRTLQEQGIYFLLEWTPL